MSESESKIEFTNLLIFVILGIPLLAQYASYFSMTDYDKNSLWTNNGTNLITNFPELKIPYMIMMFLSFIAGFYIVYYLVFRIQNKQIFGKDYNTSKYIIYTSILLLVGFSLLWMPSFYLYSKATTSIILFTVSCSSIILLASLASFKIFEIEDIAAISAASILLFQHFFLDFIIWSLINVKQ